LIAFKQNDDYRDQVRKTNAERSGYSPCCVCGRAIKDGTAKMVHIVEGGSSLALPEEEATIDPSADLGCYPIGPECLKKHPEYRPYAR
jgi:hypothetical protein